MARRTITIIGGGFSGSVLAAQLARLPGGPYACDVHLVEPRPGLGTGLAYSTPYPEHLLNVRAPYLSAFPDEPAHFTDWLRAAQAPPGEDGFCSRQTYGRYLRDLTTNLLARPAANGFRFHWHQQAAIGATVADDEQSATVQLADGQSLVSEQVVLALGNFPPLALGVAAAVQSHPGYHNNPWAPAVLPGIAPTDSVLLIGSGLTTVDVLMTLRARGFRGPATVVSRHGRWPAMHGPATATYPSFYATDLAGRTTVAAVLRVFRQHLRAAAAQGIDWRPVLDSLRPELGTIWNAWPAAEQARFLRHLASIWSVMRHRSPAQNVLALEQLRATGQLRTYAEQLTTLVPDGPELLVRLRHGLTQHEFKAHHVINCTGPLLDYSRIPDPLVVSLRQAGRLVPDALRLGIRTDAHGALLDAADRVSSVLFTLGPSRRPHGFESTAVPELRQQAAALASELATRLNTLTGCRPGADR